MSRQECNIGWFSLFSAVILVLAVQAISCIHSTEPSIQQLAVRLDTVGFPLDIGNKWYYQYQGGSLSSSVVVKTIFDTGFGGVRFVRITRLGQDSTIGTEIWRVSGENFYVGSVCLYNSSLTHDSSYSNSVYGTYDLSIHLDRVPLFGSNSRCQIRSTYSTMTYGWLWTDKRVALGIGLYHDHANGFYGESGSDYTYHLIGFMKQGVLFSDTLLTMALSRNYPSASQPSMTICYRVAEGPHVVGSLFNDLRRRLTPCVEEISPTAGSSVQTRKSLLLR